jgi:predicted hydrolase (HD superfamily)
MISVKLNICQFCGDALTGEITKFAVIIESKIGVLPVFTKQKFKEKGAAY